jgi:signal transduction histidine kinase
MSQPRVRLLVGAVCCFVVAEGALGLWFDHLERRVGREDLVGLHDGTWVLIVAVAAACAVGAVVALAQPRHPVGWLFLALSAAIMMAGPVDGYATYALLGSPGSLPAGDVAALVADREFLPWLVLTALILLLTPDGRFLSPGWRRVGQVTVGAGAVSLLLSIVSDQPLEEPFGDVRNPFAVPALQPGADIAQYAGVLLVGVGLIASAVSLVLRFRRSQGDERRRLLWLMFVAVPTPLFVVLAFTGARLGQPALMVLATGGFVTLVPIAAGLSVLRFRLYDVERIVAATLTWVLLTSILVATYAFIVWLGAQAVPSGHVSPTLSATVGALAAAGLAFPLQRGLQDLIDRRFNRRSHDARRVVRAALREERAGVDIESVLREALDDPRLSVTYPGADEEWRTGAHGSPADASVVDVDRHGRVVARLRFDPHRTDAATVRSAAGLAAAELDNARLRVELARRLEEITASRERIASAQRRERRRIERDLHDGAQQRLLALAFDLRSAHLNGDEARMRQALADGVESAQDAVRELRALANGLHPAALADGGLPAALDDLARHSPVPVRLDVDPGVSTDGGRLDAAVEFTAWLVVAEAVVNAQKHAGASTIDVSVSRIGDDLTLAVRDDGRGGARPDGPGLRGLRDRVETARGRLAVASGAGGTCIEAVLPCGS